MSDNQRGKRRRALAAILVIIVSGVVITSAFLILTYSEPETVTLLFNEINIPFGGMVSSPRSFNLTIPLAVSYIQVIINLTLPLGWWNLVDSTETEIWWESFENLNYSSPWIEVYPGAYVIQVSTWTGVNVTVTVLGKSSLLTFVQRLVASLASPIIGITAVVCIIVILILEGRAALTPYLSRSTLANQ